MRIVIALCAIFAEPALAEVVTCDLSGVPVQFEIDQSQFAPAVDPNEPPRRRVTTVQLGPTSFLAEAMRMGDMRGFSVEGTEGTEMMMVMQGDGTAMLKNALTGTKLTGTCEVLQ